VTNLKKVKFERVNLELVGGCNYTCQMCPQSTGRGKEWTKKLPFELFENILDQLDGNPLIGLHGSGEPTLIKDLPRYVEICKKRNYKVFINTNGFKLHGKFMEDVINAGIDWIRFSVVGYNSETYKDWMAVDNFNKIVENTIETSEYIKIVNSHCKLLSYHLILDSNNIDYEIDQYRKNYIEKTGTHGYIWKMHNWSGNYQPLYLRDPAKRKTCGRPWAPDITIRAGGIDKLHGAVVPCCQTMGPPNEAKSVLGHVETETIDEIWNGQLYQELRDAHSKGNFDSIDYCKDCDLLYQEDESLIWSNAPGAFDGKLIGTDVNLKDFI